MKQLIDPEVIFILRWSPTHNLVMGTLIQSIFFTVFPFIGLLGYLHRTFIGSAYGFSQIPEWKGLINALARGVGVISLGLLLLVAPMVFVYLPIAVSEYVGLVLLLLLYVIGLYFVPALFLGFNQKTLSASLLLDIARSRVYIKGIVLVLCVFLGYSVLVAGIYGLYTLTVIITIQKLVYVSFGVLYLLFSLTTYSALLVSAIISGVYTRKAYNMTDQTMDSADPSEEVPVTI